MSESWTGGGGEGGGTDSSDCAETNLVELGLERVELAGRLGWHGCTLPGRTGTNETRSRRSIFSGRRLLPTTTTAQRQTTTSHGRAKDAGERINPWRASPRGVSLPRGAEDSSHQGRLRNSNLRYAPPSPSSDSPLIQDHSYGRNARWVNGRRV